MDTRSLNVKRRKFAAATGSVGPCGGDSEQLFNQAHNKYLQIASEGGLLVGIPALCALILFVFLTVRSLKRDGTARFWMRAGAASGLVAVAVQGVWETGLRMPANGILFAVCAALAVHETHDASSGACP